VAQVTSGLRSVLSIPWVYDSFQELMGASRGRRELVRDFIRPVAGARILDLGCGTAEILKFLPEDVEYHGYDASPEYIEAARARYGKRGMFECALVDDARLATLPKMDIVLAIGLIHHLDDAEAGALFALARRALREGGRLVTIDPAFAPGQNPVARKLVSMDRGRNVRDAEGYRRLAAAAFARVTGTLRHRLWIPYTHWIMECSA
jgi:SAM-dependent methyltransferase